MSVEQIEDQKKKGIPENGDHESITEHEASIQELSLFCLIDRSAHETSRSSGQDSQVCPSDE